MSTRGRWSYLSSERKLGKASARAHWVLRAPLNPLRHSRFRLLFSWWLPQTKPLWLSTAALWGQKSFSSVGSTLYLILPWANWAKYLCLHCAAVQEVGGGWAWRWVWADWDLEPTSQCRCADVAMADRGRPRTPGTGGGKPPGDPDCPYSGWTCPSPFPVQTLETHAEAGPEGSEAVEGLVGEWVGEGVCGGRGGWGTLWLASLNWFP